MRFIRLAEELLKKETLALPDIVEILGQRPYPLKASVQQYLEELRERKVEDSEAVNAKETETETVATESNSEEEDKEKEEEKETTSTDESKKDK